MSAPHPADQGAAARRPAPGQADAIRATIGVLAAYALGLLLAGLVTLLVTSPALEEPRSAGATRAQLAMQAVVFTAAALLLVEGLRLATRPRSPDPIGDVRREGRDPRETPDTGLAVLVGLVALGAALLLGPLVSAVAPGLHDEMATADRLGLGTGLWSDLGSVLVIAGLVPIAEELLFRGVLVGAWQRAGRPLVGLALSTVLFGLAHATVGPRSVVIGALLGLLFGAAFLLGRSLAAPVLAHACLNGLALIDGGISSEYAIIALVATVLAATLIADRLSRVVAVPPRAGRLRT